MKSPRVPLLSALILSLLLAACGSLGGGATPTPLPPTLPPATPTMAASPTPIPSPTPIAIGGTLTLRHAWGEAELPALVQIIDGFRVLHPEVFFDVLYVPESDLALRFEDDTRAGHGPTLLLAPGEIGLSLAQAGLLSDTGDVLEAEQLATLNAPALQGAQFAGQQFGLPYSLQGVVLFRNRDIVTISPANFDEMVNLAQTTTQGATIGAILERSPLYSAGHLAGLGGQWMDDAGAPAFNTAEGIAWIEVLRRFEQAGPTVYLSNDDLTKFQAGEVGWIIDGTWNLRALAEAIGPENLAIDPWPAVDNGRLSGFVMGDYIYLSTQVSEQERLTAQAFIAYFLSPEAQTLLAQAGRIPAVEGVTIQDPALGPLLSQAMKALAGGTPYPLSPAWPQFNLNLDLALRAVFEQSVPPAQALQQAEAGIGAGPTPVPTP